MILNGFFILAHLTAITSASWFNRNTLSSLIDEIDHTIAACQEDNLYIQCRNRYNKIVIKSAFYGRDNYFTCTSKIFNATKLCSVHTPESVVQKVHMMCNAENKCKIPVTSTFLEKGDSEICPGIRKYLKVRYACHQNPHMHMVCHGGCPSSCWPMCQQSCCQPPPVIEQMPQSKPPSKILTISHQAAVISPMQCGNGCHSQCAPLCQPTCCQSITPTLAISPMMASVCPSDCSGSCLPLCDPTCCATRKKQRGEMKFNQPPPMRLMCPGACPDSCAPSCDLQCCAQQMKCAVGCPDSCAPACKTSCCYHQSMTVLPPPPPPPTCQAGCSPHCAPLCQPTCCQSVSLPPPPVYLPPAPPPPTCYQGCPASCAPMCQPTCCGGLPPHMQQPPQLPMMMPFPPQPQPALLAPQAPMMPMPMFGGGCSPMCTPQMCGPACAPACCSAPQEEEKQSMADGGVTEQELEARKTYQQMLKNFRQKQIQNYFRRG